MKSLEEVVRRGTKAVVLGIGGGGDIVGTLPTRGLLRLFGMECVLGGLPWERSVIDPVPGPRSYDETDGAEKINDVVWWADGRTRTKGGVRFAEAGVAEVLGERTLLVDLSGGAQGVTEGLEEALRVLGADVLFGIDVGGDAVARGEEAGLASPLADSIMTAALAELSERMPVVMGVFGFGSDGELTRDELEANLLEVARRGGLLGSWGVTPEALDEMERAIAVVPTEASRLPAEYARGVWKQTTIRHGRRRVHLSMASTVTFYLSPRVVFEALSVTARAVAGTRSLEEANRALHDLGLTTELDLERRGVCGAIRDGDGSPPSPPAGREV